MDLEFLLNEIEQGYYVFPKEIEKLLIDSIPLKYSNKTELHYCWDSFKPLHRLQLKVKPTNQFYNVIWDKIRDRHLQVLLAIDADCLQGEAQLIGIDLEKLFALLDKYYWELDEIYICDLNFDWLISLNHMFEINILGDTLIDFVQEVMQDEVCNSYMISCSQYNR